MKKYFSIILFLVLTVICLSGCFYDLLIPESDLNSEDTENGVVPGKGTLKIYLTDAPGDYLEVNIIISKIEGHIAGEGDENWDEWDVDPDILVDLIKLKEDPILLASLELEPNKYTQLRLFLMGGEEDAWVVLEEPEGSEEPTSIEFLEIPSVYQTGIKLIHPFEIIENGITELIIDFDAEKSVVKTGNGKYKLKPVIHVSSETYSEGEEPPEGLGSVSGSVSYYDSQSPELTGIGGASVSLSGGGYIFANTTTTSTVDPVGTFSLVNVPAGNYVLNVDAGEYGDYSENIEVIKNVDTPVNVVLLFEEPGTILGNVVGLVDGSLSPIGGATVSVELDSVIYSFESSTETGIEGTFSIEQLPVGFYALNVFKEGYDEYNDDTPGGIVVTAGGVTEMGEIEIDLILSTP